MCSKKSKINEITLLIRKLEKMLWQIIFIMEFSCFMFFNHRKKLSFKAQNSLRNNKYRTLLMESRINPNGYSIFHLCLKAIFKLLSPHVNSNCRACMQFLSWYSNNQAQSSYVNWATVDDKYNLHSPKYAWLTSYVNDKYQNDSMI